MDQQDELIKLAYELVVDPGKLVLLDEVLSSRLDALYSSADDPLNDERDVLSDVGVHFENALKLRKALPDQLATPSAQMSLRDFGDDEPWFTIEADGRLRSCSTSASSRFDLVAGGRIPKAAFPVEDGARFTEALTAYRKGASPGPCLFKLWDTSRERFTQFVMEWHSAASGGAVAAARPLHLNWNDVKGRAFARALRLTPAEVAITKAIVSGVSLRDLAKQRRRSLGTVRNQTKNLLAKLDLGFQTELVSLYSGFTKLSQLGDPHSSRPFLREPKREHHELTLPDGSTVTYDVFGQADGAPVLYLHPMVGGTGLTREIKDIVLGANLRLIMPWRPYYGGTDGTGTGVEPIAVFNRQLDALLADLKVDRCPVMAFNGAAPYAYAYAQHRPEQASGLLIGAGTIPLLREEQFWQMPPEQRAPQFLARHAPSVLRMYIRSVIAKIDAGLADTYIERYFTQTAVDAETVRSEEMKALMDDAFAYAFVNGDQAAVEELILNTFDWSSFTSGLSCSVHLIYGAEDTQIRPDGVRKFAGTLSAAEVEIVEDAGSFVFFQKPRPFFERLRSLMC